MKSVKMSLNIHTTVHSISKEKVCYIAGVSIMQPAGQTRPTNRFNSAREIIL